MLCKCGNQARPNQRTCNWCHATYMREYRKMKKEREKGLYEKVVHVAYGCRCVHTFHVNLVTPSIKCPTHQSEQISFTEEFRPLKPAAA